MKVVQYKDAEAFYERVERYLLPREAEHNLLFGLLSSIRQHPAKFPDAIMALVEDEGAGGALQFVAMQTDPEHNLILSAAQSTEAISLLANDLAASGVNLRGAQAMSEEGRLFTETWARLKGCTAQVHIPMRTFKLKKVIPVKGVTGTLRRAAAGDRDMLAQWEYAFMCEAFADEKHRFEDAAQAIDDVLAADTTIRGIYVWDDGEKAVSYAAYKGPTPHGIRIGPVYTPPELRGRGYASACVAEMSQRLLDSGRQFCFLFTDLRNATSNHIYQAIGYEAVCDFTAYGFE
jgi:predicted GNAT family acetyltransferase